MRKAKADYREMSDLRCPVCWKPIKLNVASRVKRRPVCYKCHRATRKRGRGLA